MPNNYSVRPFLVPKPKEKPPHPINTLPPELVQRIATYATTRRDIYNTYLKSLQTLRGLENRIREMENRNEEVVNQIIANNPNATDEELELLVDEELENLNDPNLNIPYAYENAKNFTRAAGQDIAAHATNMSLGLGRLLPEKKIPLPTPVLVSQVGPSVPVPEPTDPPPTLQPGIPVAYPV